MSNLGLWLAHKWKLCKEKSDSAQKILHQLGISSERLREEWAAQIVEQTKPLKKQSKNGANKKIEEIMTLIENRKTFQNELTQINTILLSDTVDDLEVDEMLQSSIKKKHDQLGVDGRGNLAKFKDNKFLQARMNATALKNRIRAKLRDRKFELDCLERAYRQTSSSEKKLQTHIQGSVKRHEPAVVTLITRHNKLCDEMMKLKLTGDSGGIGVVPAKIEHTGLFKLDVDDNIWQDISLEDDDLSEKSPDWLGDENTRAGIKALLEVDRCLEEETRLSRERCSMQEWMMEEWACLHLAIEAATKQPDLIYELKHRQDYLCKLCLLWKKGVPQMPLPFEMLESCGPSEEDLENTLKLYNLDNDFTGNNEDKAEDESEDELEMGGEDEELLEAIEISAMTDVYKQDMSVLDQYNYSEGWRGNEMEGLTVSTSQLHLQSVGAGPPTPLKNVHVSKHM
ncbi:hypothetical protein DXG01_009870 [Tephrocybe rancida]|nr:hypothetical protein DXG01_009870 [Tephrocybe rancida]